MHGGGKQVVKLGNPRNEGSAVPLFSGCMHLSGFQITTVPVHFNTECTGQTFWRFFPCLLYCIRLRNTVMHVYKVIVRIYKFIFCKKTKRDLKYLIFWRVYFTHFRSQATIETTCNYVAYPRSSRSLPLNVLHLFIPMSYVTYFVSTNYLYKTVTFFKFQVCFHDSNTVLLEKTIL